MIFTCIQAPESSILKAGDKWRKEKTGELREWNGTGWSTPKSSDVSTETHGDPRTGRPLTADEISALIATRQSRSGGDNPTGAAVSIGKPPGSAPGTIPAAESGASALGSLADAAARHEEETRDGAEDGT